MAGQRDLPQQQAARQWIARLIGRKLDLANDHVWACDQESSVDSGPGAVSATVCSNGARLPLICTDLLNQNSDRCDLSNMAQTNLPRAPSLTCSHSLRSNRMEQEKIKSTDPSKRYRRILSASTLAGDEVQNSAGEDLGKVDEIMIDIPSGRVAYAVVSFGGFLGMGNKLFAIPWSALMVDEDKKCFVLDVDKKTLEKAPGFDKDNWPDMAETTWRTNIHNYYGAAPYWEDQKTFRGGGGV